MDTNKKNTLTLNCLKMNVNNVNTKEHVYLNNRQKTHKSRIQMNEEKTH